MTTINNTSNIKFNEILTGISIVGNFIQQSGIIGSIWTVANQSNSLVTTDTPAETPANTPTRTQETSNTPNQIPAKTNDEIKEEVLAILKKNPSIKVDVNKEEGKEFLKNVIAKYNAITTWRSNISEEELTERITNYIKGYLYHQQENRFGLQSLAETENMDPGYSEEVLFNKDIDNANKKNDTVAYFNAFRQQAKEYIAFYDDNNDNVIDVNELIRKEVGETAKELNISPEEVDGEAIQEAAERKIANLDRNNDNVLDENEIAGYHLARNNWQGDGTTLTYNEFNDFETALIGDLGLTDEQKNMAKKCKQILSDHGIKISELPDDLSTLNLNENELKIVMDGLDALKINYNSNMAITWLESAYKSFVSK